MGKKILVVVDMQNDFIDGPLGSDAAKEVVGRVADEIAYVTSMDFNGAEGWAICATQDTHTSDYAQTQEGRMLPVLHCQSGTPGHEIHEKVIDAIASAMSQGVSCSVVGKSSFATTALTRWISSLTVKIDEVRLIGVCTDICVVSNALLIKALFPEIPVVVDASCCAGTSKERHLAALETMKSCQVKIINEGDDVYD